MIDNATNQIELHENIEIILPTNFLKERLEIAHKERRPLVIKLGFDPTAPDLHLGHAVVLRKLKQFQEHGHKIIVIIGDFTAQIGDPTGKNKTRPPLTEDQVKLNANTYVNQLSSILDISKIEIRYNSEWFNGQTLKDTIKLLSQMTLAQIMQRTDFNNRFNNNIPISLHELIYPLLQGQDSVMIKADIEIGGTDQLFNCTIGRLLQEQKGFLGQGVICMPLLRGIDGSMKMSKSENNYIGLTEMPNVMYGKVMSMPDELILDYIKLASSFKAEFKEELIKRLSSQENPMVIKKLIAYNIVEQYHGTDLAKSSENHFVKQFQSRNFEDKVYIKILLSSLNLESETEILLLDLCKILKPNESKSQIRRLILNGAIVVNTEKITKIDATINLKTMLPVKIKIGKMDYFEIMSQNQ